MKNFLLLPHSTSSMRRRACYCPMIVLGLLCLLALDTGCARGPSRSHGGTVVPLDNPLISP